MSEQKNLRSQLTQSITEKNLPLINCLILKSESLNLPWNDWTKYLVQVFAMLTDPKIQTPTFVRRSSVFNVFRLAVRIKLMDNSDIGNMKKIIEFLLRIVQAMFSAVISRRQIDKQMQKSFHSYLQKLLLSIMEADNIKTTLGQQKIKVLQKVYPVPNTSTKSTSQFICPDLILWYELFLQIKNTIQFDFLQQKLAGEYLTRISVCMKLTKEPVVRWVFIYNMVQEGLKIYHIYEPNQEIENMCGKIIVLGLTQIRQYFSVFLQVDKINDHNENIFLMTVRFNIVYLCFSLLQKVGKFNQSWVKNGLQEIKKVVSILLGRVSYERRKIAAGNNLFERLFKFELELEWIAHHSHQKQQELRRYENKQEPRQTFEVPYLTAGSKLYKKLCQDSSITVNSGKLEKFQELMENFIQTYRNKKPLKLSDLPHSSQLLLWCVGLLDKNIADFYKSVMKICSPLEQLKLCTCLLAQYHINNRTLILNTVEICLAVLEQYFASPQSIKSQEDVQNIRSAIFPLVLCRKQSKLCLCTYCGLFQMSLFCPRCGQACGEFICSNKMPNMASKWESFIKMWEYFSNNEINQVNPAISPYLIESVNLLITY